jgi:CheY-like chemotaxis protein
MSYAQSDKLPAADQTTSKPRILVVDDEKANRDTLGMVLEFSGFDVITAGDVNEALKQIASRAFDVLLTDLHMPAPGDGLTVVSAMRNSHPKAATFIFSGYPEMSAATSALLLQTDQVLLKPMKPDALVETIRKRLSEGVTPSVSGIETVYAILERESTATIDDWYRRTELDPSVIPIHLERSERCEHLPAVFRDLVHRLRYPLPLGTRALVSPDAAEHGRRRRKQGYTAAMLVEESRMLQVSIFQTLQNNLRTVDFSLLLADIMAIADEVDSQLAQAMTSYIAESGVAS